ncbi:MAG: hypothetical protein LBK99_14375, partial [Opitutaceae bacterium]|nr:hypothetical protein [Opitutaceae bacterium]
MIPALGRPDQRRRLRERNFAVEIHPEAGHVSAASNASATSVEPSRHQPVSIFKPNPLTNMSRYLNPKNDLAFKTVFGGHKTLC